MQKHNFEFTRTLRMETSYGVVPGSQQKDVKLDVTVGIDKAEPRGYFEISDQESGGNRWYAEGCLELRYIEGELCITGYDGIFDLPDFIVDKLKELGIKDEL